MFRFCMSLTYINSRNGCGPHAFKTLTKESVPALFHLSCDELSLSPAVRPERGLIVDSDGT